MTVPVQRVLRTWFVCGAVVAWVLMLLGCGGGFGNGDNAGEGEGPGHRPQALALTAEQEVKLGDEAFQEVKQQSHVVTDADLNNRVKSVGDSIFTVALENKALRREINLSDTDRKGTPWDFKDHQYVVLEDKQINAFCLPGGKVAVYTGLLELTKDKNDWLATVLSHEIAHALAHHASERIARQGMYDQAMNSMGGLGPDSDQRKMLIGLLGAGSAAYARPQASEGEHPGIFAQFTELAHDRQQESEADHIGIFLMTFADDDHDPDPAVAFWEEMEAKSGGQIPEILSDHPSDAHRVAQMKAWTVRARNAWQAWKEGRVAPAP